MAFDDDLLPIVVVPFDGPLRDTMSRYVRTRADRILRQHKVTQISEDGFLVESLTVPGTVYTVRATLSGRDIGFQCSCPAGRCFGVLCSHMTACAGVIAEEYLEEFAEYQSYETGT